MIDYHGKLQHSAPYNLPFPRKRRAGGCITTPGIWGWYEADNLTGYTDGDIIGTWEDLGPGGRHLTVNVGNPTWEENEVNGLPAVRFLNGENQVGGNLCLTTTQMSAFVVFKTPHVGVGLQYIFSSADPGLIARGFILQMDNPTDNLEIRKCGLAVSADNPPPLNQYVLADFRHRTGLTELWINGAPKVITNSGVNINAGNPALGDALMIGCALAHPTLEVALALLYERPLSDMEQWTTRECIRTKYALY